MSPQNSLVNRPFAVGGREATLEPHAVGRGEPDDPRVTRQPEGHAVGRAAGYATMAGSKRMTT